MLQAIDINQNGISSEAFTFFTALIGLIGVIIGGIFKLISDNRTLKEEARSAVKNAETAVVNTQNISNGFAKSVQDKLDRIVIQIDDLESKFTGHLEWHVNHPPSETKKEKREE